MMSALMLLKRRGFDIPDSVTERDYRSAMLQAMPCATPGSRSIATHKKYFDLYELAEELVDLEDWFQQWRFRHMKTVERIIGFKRGTGGSKRSRLPEIGPRPFFFPGALGGKDRTVTFGGTPVR